MAYIESLHYYPLTGAQAIATDYTVVGAAGIAYDRQFVFYDPDVDGNFDMNRVSQRQIPALATLSLTEKTGRGTYFNIQGPGVDTYLEPGCGDVEPDVVINEFGDHVPAIDIKWAEDNFAPLTAKYTRLRIAEKHPRWFDVGPEDIEDRANAPLHIVTTASVTELQRRAGSGSRFGADRFRPNIVINNDGDEPFIENEWTGKILDIEGIPILIQRPTPRCPVTAFDQKTGENKKDVPKLYPGLEKLGGKAIMGVYGHPLIDRGVATSVGTGLNVQLH